MKNILLLLDVRMQIFTPNPTIYNPCIIITKMLYSLISHIYITIELLYVYNVSFNKDDGML